MFAVSTGGAQQVVTSSCNSLVKNHWKSRICKNYIKKEMRELEKVNIRVEKTVEQVNIGFQD